MTSSQVSSDKTKFDNSIDNYIGYLKEYRLKKVITTKNNINGRKNRQNLGCLYDFLEKSTNILASSMEEYEEEMRNVKSKVDGLATAKITELSRAESPVKDEGDLNG